MVPVILLPPAEAALAEAPLFAEIPDAPGVVVPLLEIPVDTFADTVGEGVSVASSLEDLSDGVGVMAIAVDSSFFFPHPVKDTQRIPIHKIIMADIVFLFMIILLNTFLG